MEIATNQTNIIAEILAPDSFILGGKAEVTAREALAKLSIPTTRLEDWKYTRLTKLKANEFSVNKTEALNAEVLIDNHFNEFEKVVLVNGFYRSDLSNFSSDSITINTNENALFSSEPISQLNDFFRLSNLAYCNQNINIVVAKNKVVEKPLLILNILAGSKQLVQPRINILAEKFSESSFILATQSQDASHNLFNQVVNIKLEDSAHLKVDKIQMAKNNFLFQHEAIEQKSNSNFGINTFCLEGSIIRNDLHINANGENCESELFGIFIPNEKELFDNHTLMDHKKPNCNSSENYRGVLMGESTGVFNGKVFVRKDAQKINAFQENKNVLLSKMAQIYAKPELEIYADDVKCSHGSTTGMLDEKALFYLQSRGIGREKARVMLVKAFIHANLENVYCNTLLSILEQAVEEKLK